jgi:hypothetical protein
MKSRIFCLAFVVLTYKDNSPQNQETRKIFSEELRSCLRNLNYFQTIRKTVRMQNPKMRMVLHHK